jgi:hypothetical protein
MKQHRRRKCRHCGDLFRPDPRNLRHQRHCTKPASAAGSTSRRTAITSRGLQMSSGCALGGQPIPATGAALGRKARRRYKRTPLAQAIEAHGKSPTLAEIALQDFFCAQPVVLIGLIANLTGSALQEDIARTARRLRQLGQDIVASTKTAAGDAKTSVGPLPSAPGPPPVQLGGPAPSA